MVSVACWALLLSSYSASTNAQVDQTTGNLINFTGTPTATTGNWVNGVYVNQICFQAGQPGNCGPNPSIRASSGSINFSYGQVDLHQIVNINQALTAVGSGVRLSGFNFSFAAKNGNGWDDGRQDYLSAYVKLYSAAGALAGNYDYTQYTNQRYNWTNFNFTETFANPVLATNYSTARVGFIGRDSNYWAGNYGPEITSVGFRLNYQVDPCSLNPAYSPTCSGFNTVVTSGNVLPDPNAWGQSIYQAAAINTALKSAGIGATVHGIRYSFDWAVGGQQCTDTFLFWCTGWSDSNINVNVRLTNSNGSLAMNRNYGYSGQNISGGVSDTYLLPRSLNQSALGTVSMSSSGSGDSAAGNFRTQLMYTPDPCAKDPLYSPNCSGYAQAMALKLSSTQSTSNTTIVEPAPASTSVVATANVTQSTPQQTSNTSAAKGSPQSKTVAAALSTIAKNQQREQAIQNSAVQMATTEAAAAGDRAQQQAVSVAAAAVTMSQTLSNASVQTQRQTNTASAGTAPVSQAQSGPLMINTAPVNNDKSVTAAVTTTVQTPAPRVNTAVVSVSSNVSTANDTQYSMISAAQSYFSRAQTQPVQETATSSTPPQPNKSATAPVATVIPITVTTTNTAVFSQANTDYQQSTMISAYTQPQNTMFYAMAAAPVEQQQQITAQAVSIVRQAEIEQVSSTSGFMTNRTDPLNEVVESKPVAATSNTAESAQTVKANVSDNELAGGVDINKLATTPVGYSNYTSLMLKDGKMYEPKEIYKNQTPVDNARALRQLSTDRLHQQMIEQQYRR